MLPGEALREIKYKHWVEECRNSGKRKIYGRPWKRKFVLKDDLRGDDVRTLLDAGIFDIPCERGFLYLLSALQVQGIYVHLMNREFKAGMEMKSANFVQPKSIDCI